MATEWQKPVRKGPRQKGGKTPVSQGKKQVAVKLLAWHTNVIAN